jgi:hypothetical protein
MTKKSVFADFFSHGVAQKKPKINMIDKIYR